MQGEPKKRTIFCPPCTLLGRRRMSNAFYFTVELAFENGPLISQTAEQRPVNGAPVV